MGEEGKTLRIISVRFCICAFLLVGYHQSAGAVTQQPNVVVIVADDQGFGDVGFNGNTKVDTPVLDRLAARGVVLDQFHVSPVCSPTRASLLTGRHSLRTGVWSVTRGGETMRSSEVTLAEAFRNNGYLTAIFGKWHNGSHFPSDPYGQGFARFRGFVEGHSNNWNPTQLVDGRTEKRLGYLPDLIADDAVEFINEKKNKPFFLYLPFSSPHSPFEAKEELFTKYKARHLSDLDAAVYAMIDNLDSNIGRILNALEKAKIDKNTIVIFLSDNGPAFPGGISRYNAGMKGWKGSVDEGGTRVPFIAYWPGRIEGGNRLDIAAQHIDLFPTLMALIGARAAKGPRLDGRSLATVLRGGSPNPTLLNRSLFTHHFRNTQKPSEVAIKRGPGAVRAGDFLATMDATEKWSLYNVKRDPSQQVDLATQDSIRLNRLIQEYDQWFTDVSRNAGARIPIEVGVQGHPKVLLQAHEASLFGEGIKYQSGAGWANDWISDWTSSIGFAQWQLRVVRSGYYRVTLSYSASPSQAGARVAAEFGGTSVGHRLPVTPPSKDDWGRRLFFTDEAPERQWHEIMLGDVYLKKGLLSLNLRAQDITHDGAGDIKSVRIDHIKS